MKLTIERSLLVSALATAQRAISRSQTLPILSHVLLDARDDRLQLSATDLDTYVRCSVAASIDEDGAIALPAASFGDWVSKLPDAPITLEEIEGKVKAKCGRSTFNFPGAPDEDFPMVPDVSKGVEISVASATLKEMLRLTTFAASKEETRSLLMGVLFEARGNTLTLVATDTHRLAWKQTMLQSEVEVPTSAIVPAKPLGELERLLPKGVDERVTIRFGSSQVQFQVGDTVLISRVLDGQYPNYEKVIPKQSDRTAQIVRAEWLSAVRRIDIVSRFASQKMKCKFSSSTLTMTAESSEAGQSYEEIPIALDGSDLGIAFNAKYLAEVLGLVDEKELTLEMRGALQPGILRASNDFIYVVMPMQD